MTQRTTTFGSVTTIAAAAIATLMIGAFAGASAAQAETETSQAKAGALTRLYMGDEMLGIKPVLGFNTYNDSLGGRSTRGSIGVAAEFNLASPIGIDYTRWFIGPQTGLTFSHLGNADSNAFGASSNINTGEGGANLFLIPVNLKASFSTLSWLRTGVHGGANVMYRSVASAVRIDNTNLNWRLIPNVGADVEFAISKAVAFTVRPDWTLSSTQSLFSATAALGIAL